MTLDNDDPQAAANGSDDQLPAGSEEQGAQGNDEDESLDKILADIGAENARADAADDAAAKDEQGKADETNAAVQSILRREVRRDVATAVDAVQKENETLKGLDSGIVESLMQGEAAKDKRVQAAWVNRDEDPETWNKVRSGLGKKIAKGLGGTVDANATADQNAVIAAANGKSPGRGGAQSVDNSALTAMTDAEFKAHKATLGS